jgi:hypothetical protein
MVDSQSVSNQSVRLTVSYEPHNLLHYSGRATVQVVSRRPLALEAQVGQCGTGQASLKAFQLLRANYRYIISKY